MHRNHLNGTRPTLNHLLLAIAILGFGLGILTTGLTTPALAQDIPGIENCMAEKAIDRRTGCLQSNVNYLKAQLTQLTTLNLNKLDAANRQIDALKSAVVTLQTTVAELKSTADKKTTSTSKPEPAKPDAKSETQKSDTPADSAKK